ncbi:hypothetical protein [Cupriavidus necator]|uniref:hypothetical protein n=1 Tax=Cupriavidus necator TaxID=106590 RepID=UPI0005B3D51A|nr:hypothetical protein [Cupriavidus necator]
MSKNGNKGFAGLSSMISDVDAALADVASSQPERSGSSDSASRGKASTVPPKAETVHAPEESSSAALPASAGQKSGSSVGNWVLAGIAIAVIVLAYALSPKDHEPTTVASSASADPAPTYTPQESPPPPGPVIAEPTPPALVVPEVATRPTEVKPAVGSNNVLSLAEIRYCAAEKIRLDAGERLTDRSNQLAIQTYNTGVMDFNSRCGSFRYHGNDVVTAKAEVEQFRGEIEVEAMVRFRSSAPEPAPSAQQALYGQPFDRNQYGAAATPSSRYSNTSRLPQYSTTEVEEVEEDEEEKEE